jgi:hypothetical protein
MRKVIVLLALGVLAASSASAASFWTESFAYSNGNLAVTPNVSGGLWANHGTSTATTALDIQVVGGEAAIVGLRALDDNRSFTPVAAGASTYACFKMKVVGTETTGSAYFLHFSDGGTSNFVARTFATIAGATTFTIGISSTNGAIIYFPGTWNKDTYYNVSIKWNGTASTGTLWVEPTLALGESSPSVTAVAAVPAPSTIVVSSLALRQATGYGTVYVDDITVGDTFCPGDNPVPTTNNSWSAVKGFYR